MFTLCYVKNLREKKGLSLNTPRGRLSTRLFDKKIIFALEFWPCPPDRESLKLGRFWILHFFIKKNTV